MIRINRLLQVRGDLCGFDVPEVVRRGDDDRVLAVSPREPLKLVAGARSQLYLVFTKAAA